MGHVPDILEWSGHDRRGEAQWTHSTHQMHRARLDAEHGGAPSGVSLSGGMAFGKLPRCEFLAPINTEGCGREELPKDQGLA